MDASERLAEDAVRHNVLANDWMRSTGHIPEHFELAGYVKGVQFHDHDETWFATSERLQAAHAACEPVYRRVRPSEPDK